jgi:hypothetical protein
MRDLTGVELLTVSGGATAKDYLGLRLAQTKVPQGGTAATIIDRLLNS